MKFKTGILASIFNLIAPIGFLRLWVDDPDTSDLGGDDGGSDATSATIGTGNDARLKLLNDINDQNDRDRADELRFVNDDGTTEDFVADGETPPVVEDEDPEPAIADPAPPAVTKIKVNGEEVELTPELIAKAQKIASADKYLEDASRVAKTPPVAAPTTPTPPPPTQGVEDRSADDRALVRAIQMGTEEEAMAALQKLRTNQAPAISADVIGRIADERLEFKSALSWFESEYKDLVNDEQLNNIVMERDAALVKAGDKRSYRERYEAIGNEVREWRDGMVKKYAPTPTPVPADDKLQRKATAPKAPTTANVKGKPPANDDDTDEDTSSVIANMAKSRGGPQWARG